MKDIINDIRTWHIKTFPNANNEAISLKAYEEMYELQIEMCGNNKEKIKEEIADVMIVLIAYCVRNGIDIENIIDEKMMINKSRKFGKEDKDGGRERIKNG